MSVISVEKQLYMKKNKIKKISITEVENYKIKSSNKILKIPDGFTIEFDPSPNPFEKNKLFIK